MGGCALVIGILLGNFLFQVLQAIIFALFGIPYFFSFFFSVKAVGLTLVYFLFIYLFAQMKSRRRIRRMKIHDLIYFDKQNEDAVIRTSSRRRKIFTVSIIIGILGTSLLMTGGTLPGVIGAGCIIAFLYGFFLSFASGVPAFLTSGLHVNTKTKTYLCFGRLPVNWPQWGLLWRQLPFFLQPALFRREPE